MIEPMKKPTKASPIAQRIREFRLRRKLSQAALAKLAGVSRGAIAKLETGQRQDPSVETLMALAHALMVSVADLAGRSSSPIASLVDEFADSHWAKALAAEGRPITEDEKALLRRIVETIHVFPLQLSTLNGILVSIRNDPASRASLVNSSAATLHEIVTRGEDERAAAGLPPSEPMTDGEWLEFRDQMRAAQRRADEEMQSDPKWLAFQAELRAAQDATGRGPEIRAEMRELARAIERSAEEEAHRIATGRPKKGRK